MSAPRIGEPVRGSASGRPIMVALDALGRRGALRILWELRGDPLTFRALQAASDMNPGSLNTRLKELRALQIVAHSDGGYHLTGHGLSLMAALKPLQVWAEDWAQRAEVATVSPDTITHR